MKNIIEGIGSWNLNTMKLKNNKHELLIGIVLITILFSCTKPGDEYIGTWQNTRNAKELIISNVGNNIYSVIDITPAKYPDYQSSSRTKTANYQDGNLTVMGTIFLSYSNGIVLFNGERYKKVK